MGLFKRVLQQKFLLLLPQSHLPVSEVIKYLDLCDSYILGLIIPSALLSK